MILALENFTVEFFYLPTMCFDHVHVFCNTYLNLVCEVRLLTWRKYNSVLKIFNRLARVLVNTSPCIILQI